MVAKTLRLRMVTKPLRRRMVAKNLRWRVVVKPLSIRIWNREQRDGFRVLMGAKMSTIEHRNVALATLEHDRSAQGFYKTGTVVRLQDKGCREVARQGLSWFHWTAIAQNFANWILLTYQLHYILESCPQKFTECIAVWHKLGLSLQRKLKFRYYVRGYYLLRYRF